VGVGNPKGPFRPPFAAIFGSKAVETQARILGMCLLVVIPYGDSHTRRIPNFLVCAIAVLGSFRMTVAGDGIVATHSIEASGAVLAVEFIAFWRGVVGGGDAKLLTAMALLVGSRDLLGFLFVMSMCGGALALMILARDRLRQCYWHSSRQEDTEFGASGGERVATSIRSTVPYGGAIAAAGIIALLHGNATLR
jgi:prepilin peptidase CpaA